MLGLWAAFLAAACACWSAGYPLAAMGLPPLLADDPTVVMHALTGNFRGDRALAPDNMRKLRRAAELGPLQEGPLLISAFDRVRSGNEAAATGLLEEARRRNPRNLQVRMALFERYARAGNGEAAVGELSVLSRIAPTGKAALGELLAKMMNDPVMRSSAIRALPSSPLRIEALQKISLDGATAGFLIQMAQDLKGFARVKGNARPISIMIDPFVKRGDISGARELWAHFYAVDAARSHDAIFDGSFDERAGPPFGWDITSSSAGLAEIRGGALRIRYYARDATVFASELIALPAGFYRLVSNIAMEPGSSGAPNLSWRVQCQNGDDSILDASFPDSFRIGEVTSEPFEVPAQNCSAQWLSLVGYAENFPVERSLDIRLVQAQPVTSP